MEDEAAALDSVNEWCDLFWKTADKHLANAIIDAVNRIEGASNGTIIVACTHLLGALLTSNDDRDFLPSLLIMIDRASQRQANKEDTMVTRASGSQSTQHAPKAGQNKPVSGGAAGQGKARGGATMPNITKTSPKTIPTKR